METGEALLYVGFAVMGLAGVGGIVSAVAMRISEKKLAAQLDAEYGEKRH